MSKLSEDTDLRQGSGPQIYTNTSRTLLGFTPMDWEHIGLTGDYTWDFTLKNTRP